MDENKIYRLAITSCYTKLLDDIDARSLLDLMMETSYFPRIVLRDISEARTSSEMNRKIIDRVMSKGPKEFQTFLILLKNSGNEWVAEMMQDRMREIREKEGGKVPADPGRSKGYDSKVSKMPSKTDNQQPRPVQVTIPGQPRKIQVMEPSSIEDGQGSRSGPDSTQPGELGRTRGDTSIDPALPDMSGMSLSNQSQDSQQNLHAQPVSTVFPQLVESTSHYTGEVEMDNAGIPDSSGPPSSLFFEQFTEKKQRVKFEGRIIEMSIDWFEKYVKKSRKIAVGGYGEVYALKEKNEMPFVIKKIDCRGDVGKQKSAVCEMLAARLMHFAIVPVLAMVEDVQVSRDTYYFMLPYLENGSLAVKLSSDGKQIRDNQKPKIELDKDQRMRILLQIACAMEFLHKEVKDFRGSYIHRDITSGNIVLDKYNNARLLDFGLAREYTPGRDGVTVKQTDLMGTEGYFRTMDKTRMTVNTDCSNFGVVILEALASKPPVDAEGKKLLPVKYDHFYEDHDDNIDAVWNEKLTDFLIDLSEMCWNQKINAKEIREKLQETMEGTGTDFWNESEEDVAGQKNCDICMINPVTMEARNILNHTNRCHLYVCVACMRNSHLNPIQCHTCLKDVIPPIGHQWAALLIAGNDCEEKESAKVFKQDVDLVHKAITSRHPLTMGISKDHVYCVCPKSPGKEEELLPQMEEQLKKLVEHKPKTLLVYFNGHHAKDLGFSMGNKNEYLTTSKLKDYIQQAVEGPDSKSDNKIEKVIVLLDCCEAQAMSLDLSVAYVQINSCGPSQSTGVPQGIGSLFTNFLLDALKGKSSQEKCLLARLFDLSKCSLCEKYKSENGFIMINNNLLEFIRLHVNEFDKKWGKEGCHNINCMSGTQSSKDSTFGYFIDSPAKFNFSLEFPGNSHKFPLELPQLPDTYEELMAKLFESYTEKFSLSWLRMTGYADILAVMVSYGPKAMHKYERTKLFQLEAAWNGKQKLCVSLRKLEQLQYGPVGVFMQSGNAQDVLKILTQDDMKSLCQHLKKKNQDKVLVSLENKGARELWMLVKKKKDVKDNTWSSRKELINYLKTIKDNDSIQEEGKLVFKFPHVDGVPVKNFFAIYIEQTVGHTEMMEVD